MEIKSLLEDCKKKLIDNYGAKYHSLILYGSMARGEADKSSDIDLLVLLFKPFDYFEELKKIINILYPIQLDSECLISAKPVAEDEFASGKIHLYRTARREGTAA